MHSNVSPSWTCTIVFRFAIPVPILFPRQKPRGVIVGRETVTRLATVRSSSLSSVYSFVTPDFYQSPV